MKSAIRFALGLAALFPARAVFADDNSIRVDVVVNMTEEGYKLPPPNPENPTYYIPCTAGYLESGAVLVGEKPPPPTVDVQRMLARALADRGYLVMNKKHHPSIILAFWWGYMSPITGKPYGDTANGSLDNNPSGGGIYMPGIGGTGTDAGQGLLLPTGAFEVTPNAHDMFTLVAGSNFEEQIGKWDSFGAYDSLHEAAHHPRYFLMVSALDFQAATQRKAGSALVRARQHRTLAGRTLDGSVADPDRDRGKEVRGGGGPPPIRHRPAPSR